MYIQHVCRQTIFSKVILKHSGITLLKHTLSSTNSQMTCKCVSPPKRLWKTVNVCKNASHTFRWWQSQTTCGSRTFLVHIFSHYMSHLWLTYACFSSYNLILDLFTDPMYAQVYNQFYRDISPHTHTLVLRIWIQVLALTWQIQCHWSISPARHPPWIWKILIRKSTACFLKSCHLNVAYVHILHMCTCKEPPSGLPSELAGATSQWAAKGLVLVVGVFISNPAIIGVPLPFIPRLQFSCLLSFVLIFLLRFAPSASCHP